MMMFAVAAVSMFAMSAMASNEETFDLESIPMVTYKKDCWKKRPVSLSQLPGAGIDEFKPYELVEKDGYYEVGCF